MLIILILTLLLAATAIYAVRTHMRLAKPPQSPPSSPRKTPSRFPSENRNGVIPPRPDTPSQRSQTPPPLPLERRHVSLDLNASQFQPLSAEQVRQQAASSDLSRSWRFNRTDRIPALDARTQLIDQAMVGQGMITPDELARIHKIGQQYDKLRPDILTAHATANQALEADKEERRRIRAEKKAAAEQRKRDHAARVADNKLNDIIHLGRGVSAGLADRRTNVEGLQQRKLPLLSSPADVATALAIPIPRLRWLAYHAEASTVSHYVQFIVPKKSGGERTLSAPHQQLATVQRWILENILNHLPAHGAAHGFVKGRSILTNAAPHVRSAVVINCDLTDFFPSITVHRVIGFFKQIGYSPAVSTILALLVTESPRRKVLYNGRPWHVATGSRALPQGACTSPAISNLISRRLDSRLDGIARKLGFTYTRYADDLTFSSAEPTDRVGYLLARVRHVTADEGFTVNEKKTRILKPAARQTVTGITVNAHPSTSRKTRRQLRAILHNASKTGLSAQNRTHQKHYEAQIGGRISFVEMVNPQQATNLRQQFDSLNP